MYWRAGLLSCFSNLQHSPFTTHFHLFHEGTRSCTASFASHSEYPGLLSRCP
jgi:hypothetical protein